VKDENKITRRVFLKRGAGIVTSLSLVSISKCKTSHESFPEHPNFLILITDQERYHSHWPDGWVDQHMPSWPRLKQNGVTFTRAYCAASMCSPSRACLLTGEYYKTNEIPRLDDLDGMPGQSELPNIGSILRDQAGYDVVWKGKWHLSYPLGFEGGKPSEEVWQKADIEELNQKYGMQEWNPPEAGNNAFDSVGARATFGGGTANNDGRFVQGTTSGEEGQTPGFGESVLDYLAKVAATPPSKRNPFCLFVSLVNPHDIAFYPNGWDVGGYHLEDFANLGIELPSNYADQLTTKPDVQKQFLEKYDQESKLDAEHPALNFVNFYAYLHKVIDQQIQTVLDALDAHGLTNDTIIIRTADHGEMGLSHGLREKSYSAYEEVIHIPLVISNPWLFPKPKETTALYSHIDLLATVADLAGVKPVGVGTSMVPILQGEKTAVQDSVLFTFDDVFVLDEDAAGSHIRALRTERWTYAVYYSVDGTLFQYELYDNENDPGQLENLLYNPSNDIKSTWEELHQKLTAKMTSMRARPDGFTWPATPT
jgi:arylsulfatase A-like enzyme